MSPVRTLIRRLFRRMALVVGRAVLEVVDDERQIQAVQLQALDGEVVDGAERFQQYGFTSHPHPGAEAVLLALGGERQHPIVPAIDDRRYRPRGLAEGEVCLYTSEDTADAQHRIIFKRGRGIALVCGSSKIVMSPTEILLDADHIGLND